MNLTEEQKAIFLERYLKNREYSKEYYKNYQKEHKEELSNNTKKYMEKVKNDEEKLEQFKQKKRDYYLARGKDLYKIRYEKKKEKKVEMNNIIT